MTPAPRRPRSGLSLPLILLLAPLVGAAADAPGTAVPPAIIDDEIGVLRLFDEFVSSGAAASRCAMPDNQAAVRFLSNFQWISSHATREIGRQMPSSSTEDVAAELARRSQAVKDRTHALVKAEGCEGPAVVDLVRRFSVQASWKRAN